MSPKPAIRRLMVSLRLMIWTQSLRNNSAANSAAIHSSSMSSAHRILFAWSRCCLTATRNLTPSLPHLVANHFRLGLPHSEIPTGKLDSLEGRAATHRSQTRYCRDMRGIFCQLRAGRRFRTFDETDVLGPPYSNEQTVSDRFFASY